MSPYLSYIRAFGRDLKKVAVWEPGAAVEIGDYGVVRKDRWERLGSIWDRLPAVTQRLQECDVSTLDLLSRGTSEAASANVGASYSGAPGQVAVTVAFDERQSVFVRAEECETKSLRRVQDLAELIVEKSVWEKDWTLVTELCSAKRFLVLVAASPNAKARITARSTELLEAFGAGRIDAKAGVEVTGSDVIQFVGRSGPLHMSLVRIKGPSLLRSRTSATRVDFAEGQGTAEPVFLENFGPEMFAEVAERLAAPRQ